ncbi:hypothetical protein AB0A69_15435 [Streptomyces sp. NPDC045431]|uniref:hypothetical protein n=1 Tax=Streptomyces sp. NPDC045431 TaxID=3155613 RepID=UPI0033EFD292
MARHTLLQAGLTLSALGAALGAGGGTAHAVPSPVGELDTASAMQGVQAAAPHVVGAAKNLKINPLAQTGVDPLNNGVGTQVGDFQPVSTTSMTGSLTSAPNLPVAGPLLGGALPG